MSRPFQFKEFTIIQDHAAMKVGTDSVLLGAWTNHSNPKMILDIGCGTALLTLMMAQRFQDAVITGVEIDSHAMLDAKLNVDRSAWGNRIDLIEGNFFEVDLPQYYDLIISNPPFFSIDTPSPIENRAVARSGKRTLLNDWIIEAKKKMQKSGVMAVILPMNQKAVLEKIANDNDLFIHRICLVKPNTSKEAHRFMVELQLNKCDHPVIESIMIEKEIRHDYSDEYIKLTRSFYLNMD